MKSDNFSKKKRNIYVNGEYNLYSHAVRQHDKYFHNHILNSAAIR